MSEPWTPNEIDEFGKRFDFARKWTYGKSEESWAAQAFATIRALQAEIRELKTPTGYWDDEGYVIWKPDGEGFDHANTVADLETMLYQELVDDGDTVTFTPYHALPPEKYAIRWVPDADDPDMRRVRLERVEE